MHFAGGVEHCCAGVLDVRLYGLRRYEKTAACRGRGLVGGLRYGAGMASMTVARRIPVCGSVNAGKAAKLASMGAELDRVRTEVWSRYSGVKTAHLSKRQIRDQLMSENAPAGFAVPQRLWRATVEDTVDNIRAFQQAVIATEVCPTIYRRTGADKTECKRLLALAKSGRWRKDPWLSRQVRKAFVGKAPRPRASGRIVADNCSYDVARDEKGQVWLAVMTTNRRQRLRLNLGPLPEEVVPTSTIQIRADGKGGWQVIAAYPAHRVSSIRPQQPNPTSVEGIDAGISEVFTDTSGCRYGAGQYEKVAARAERDRARSKARDKVRAVRDRHLARAAAAAEAGNQAAAYAARPKAARIDHHNLGRNKLSRQRVRDRAITKDAVYQAVHDLVDTTAHVVAEDLSGLRGRSKFGRIASRIYAAWQRSFLADALASVPSRRGSALTLVNPAYTSQQVHPCGHLGVRRGKNVYCQTAGCPQQGIVFDTEINAARVIRDRATDPQISRHTPTSEVKRILIERVGTVENCPTTTQATATPGGCERSNSVPKRALHKGDE